MASVNRVYAARLAGMVVLGPDGESLGRVRDVVVSISIVRQQPRVLGLVVELLTRRRIFVPILRVTAIEPNAVTLNTANVSLRRFIQRPGEVLVLGQVLDSRVRVNDPGTAAVGRGGHGGRRSGNRADTHAGLDGHPDSGAQPATPGPTIVGGCGGLAGRRRPHPSALAMPGQGVAQLLHQFEGQRPIEVADALRDLPAKRRTEVMTALDDERLADILQELPEVDQTELVRQLDTERAADVLEAMDPDDAADLLGVMNPTEAEVLLRRMDPEDRESVRRLLSHSPDTAGGLMTSDPVVLAPDTTVAEALAGCVTRPDPGACLDGVRGATADGNLTGRYLGCVHHPGAASRTAGQSGQRHRRQGPASAVPGHAAGGPHPLPCRLQPGLRSGGRRRATSSGSHRRRRARPSTSARLARDLRRSRPRPVGHDERRDVSDYGRLETPRTSRRPSFNIDPEVVGRFSESIARFLGTGRYLLWQTVVVIVWICLNLFAVGLRWDPYPFILLNLAFSTQAAYAAPLILLAQNRQENRDKVSLEDDRRRSEQTKADTEFLAGNSRPFGSRSVRGCHPRLPAPGTRGVPARTAGGAGSEPTV